ncbi:hypothetical protein MHU86_21061 [Fragilaria crotonensis]|nr:hypothetical protein MHU86_21061 [Fragilaria crotonensis]
MTKVRIAFSGNERRLGTFSLLGDPLPSCFRYSDGRLSTESLLGGRRPRDGIATNICGIRKRSFRLLADLNDLEVTISDFENDYLTAPEGEKIWCRLGLLFEANAEIVAVSVRALYSLKTADADFMYRLADCMIAAFGLRIMRGRSGRVSKVCLYLRP